MSQPAQLLKLWLVDILRKKVGRKDFYLYLVKRLNFAQFLNLMSDMLTHDKFTEVITSENDA